MDQNPIETIHPPIWQTLNQLFVRWTEPFKTNRASSAWTLLTELCSVDAAFIPGSGTVIRGPVEVCGSLVIVLFPL